MNAWITQLRKGVLEFLILSVIARGETYGYELIQRLKSLDDLPLSESTVYPILERLRSDGALQMRTEPSRSGPDRRYYSLSKLGEHRMREMNRYWDRLSRSIESLREPMKGGTNEEQHRP
jgi:PadR family transcriptional regulator PadR